MKNVDHFGERLDRNPVQLNILPHHDVGDVASIFPSDPTDSPHLLGSKDAVGNADPHHEIFGGIPFPVLTTDSAHAVALGVDPPHLK
jgi:hypothetical protein